MKKVLLLSLISFGIVMTPNVFAQKKGKNLNTSTVPSIKTEADSLSYAYGAAMTQGLSQYLIQLGVLGDTATITADYKDKINSAADSKKAILEKELKNKLDSVNAANTQSMEQFILGFKQAAFSDNKSQAFNSGISIASQVLGMSQNFSKEMLGDDEAFNKDAFVSSFSTVLQNGTPLISLEDAQKMLQTKGEIQMQKKQAEMEKTQKEEASKIEAQLRVQYAEQIAAGDKFLAENKTKDGVVTLPDGLQYKIITEGNGKKPTTEDMVKVHYKGTLIDGTQFDSSYERNMPATFGVGQVIKGWTEALQLMPVGSKWILYIPYDLAYGTREQGIIKPFSNLIFEVELLDIVKHGNAE
ncbi:MAG: FKBP-type peptidyl-prolyl cis-trans isomerase [Dysgonomonas sp.]